ncbi:hypothetical protein [Comamonas testosteroni]
MQACRRLGGSRHTVTRFRRRSSDQTGSASQAARE